MPFLELPGLVMRAPFSEFTDLDFHWIVHAYFTCRITSPSYEFERFFGIQLLQKSLNERVNLSLDASLAQTSQVSRYLSFFLTSSDPTFLYKYNTDGLSNSSLVILSNSSNSILVLYKNSVDYLIISMTHVFNTFDDCSHYSAL